jgi:hypothetical protein
VSEKRTFSGNLNDHFFSKTSGTKKVYVLVQKPHELEKFGHIWENLDTFRIYLVQFWYHIGSRAEITLLLGEIWAHFAFIWYNFGTTLVLVPKIGHF